MEKSLWRSWRKPCAISRRLLKIQRTVEGICQLHWIEMTAGPTQSFRTTKLVERYGMTYINRTWPVCMRCISWRGICWRLQEALSFYTSPFVSSHQEQLAWNPGQSLIFSEPSRSDKQVTDFFAHTFAQRSSASLASSLVAMWEAFRLVKDAQVQDSKSIGEHQSMFTTNWLSLFEQKSSSLRDGLAHVPVSC